eukprot:gene17236-20541_t
MSNPSVTTTTPSTPTSAGSSNNVRHSFHHRTPSTTGSSSTAKRIKAVNAPPPIRLLCEKDDKITVSVFYELAGMEEEVTKFILNVLQEFSTKYSPMIPELRPILHEMSEFPEKCKITKNRRFSRNDPKGPWCLPIVGGLPLLGAEPHLSLMKMTQTYGNVFRLFMGDYYTIVVSDPSFIKQVWIKNFDNFIDRPHLLSLRLLSRNFQGLVAGDEKIWRHNRRLVSSSFTKTKLQSLHSIYDKQAANLVAKFKEFQVSGQVLNPRIYLRKFTLNVIFNLLFSAEIPYEESVDHGRMAKLSRAIDSIFKMLASGSSIDYITSIGKLFILLKKLRGPSKGSVLEAFADATNSPKDLFDLMIIESENNTDTRVNMILVAVDFIVAGMETSASTIEWLILFMVNYPQIQERARKEILNAANGKSAIDLSHRVHMPYLSAVIKEVMRIKPIASLGLPRSAKDSIVIDGVFIPQGTQMIMNIYALHHDPALWPDPEVFKPERFLGCDPQQYSDKYIPFGCGPRSCIGRTLSEDEIFLASANILLNFKLSSQTGEKLNESDVFGLAIHPNQFGIQLDPVVVKP